MTNREAYENMCDELEHYREIGTAEELKNVGIVLIKRNKTLERMIDECMEYEKIGTVEECREAREKQITAFDKEKVIEQIKVLSAGIILNTNISDDYAEGYARSAKDIIEIIEKGGIE